ncbi:MAG: response regulator, partial [Methylococcales bacterium]|nr:response regulator [Methylococcales bacterium]
MSLEKKVDELRLANEQMKGLKEEAEAANAAKSAFIANISHEIRTPMSAILGFAEMLSESGISEEEKQDNIATIVDNGYRLLGIINDILDVSKAESGKISVANSNCFIAETVYSIHRVLLNKSRALDVELKFTNTTPIPEVVTTDPKRLEQILINLLTNAVKFSEGGRVTLSLSYSEEQQRLSFEVTDTGIGINNDAVHRIFEPFGQADDSSSRRYGGTGLGLVLSRKLARLLGGELELTRTEPGKGSTFTTWISAPIPSKYERAQIKNLEQRILDYHGHHGRLTPKAPGITEDEKTPFEGTHVLMVDDSEDNRNLVQFMLRGSGVDLDMAVNGKDALSKTLHKSYDLILMDIQMPELDGYG